MVTWAHFSEQKPFVPLVVPFFSQEVVKIWRNKRHMSETYHTNLVGSPWIVDPVCRIYVPTYSPNYISLVIYLSTYQLPKLAYLLAYL